jgi:hypothetical protein
MRRLCTFIKSGWHCLPDTRVRVMLFCSTSRAHQTLCLHAMHALHATNGTTQVVFRPLNNPCDCNSFAHLQKLCTFAHLHNGVIEQPACFLFAGTKQFPTCTTGANGRCNVLVSSGIPGPMTSSATTTGQNGQPLSETGPNITWVAPAASPSPSPQPNTERLTIAATPNQVPVNGSVTVSATYTVNGVPTAGKVVTFEVIRPDGSKINPTCTTTAAGKGSC